MTKLSQSFHVISVPWHLMKLHQKKKKLHVLSMLTKTSNSIREKDINTKEAEEKQEQLGIKKLRIKILGKIILNEI